MSTSGSAAPRRNEVEESQSRKGSDLEHLTSGFLGNVLRFVLMIGVCYVAYTIRLHAVNVFGRVIHEFDPWFNYRATQYLADHGFHAFWNWFDDQAWYPIGRHVGSTIYPGMMITSWLLQRFFTFLGFDISVNDVCVFVPAGFAMVTCCFMFLLTYEISGSPNAAVISAAIMAIIPAHMMRSVAGGYDNESVAVPLIVGTVWAWARSVRDERSWPFGFVTAALYAYLVGTWGAYTFIINLIGIHAGVLVLLGRYSDNLHKAYSIFWVLGTAGALQFPIVGWQPVSSLEQMGPMLLFFGLQIWWFIEQSRSKLSPAQFSAYRIQVLAVAGGIGALIFAGFLQMGYLGAFSNRVRSLFIKHTRTGNPLVDSVAEHQATDPAVFVTYFHQMYYIGMAGFVMLWFKPSNAKVLGIIYTALAWYFSSKMVRLILLLSPPASYNAGIALWGIATFSYKTFFGAQTEAAQPEADARTPKKDKTKVGGNDPWAAFQTFLDHPFIKTYGALILASVLVTYSIWACMGFTRHSYEMSEHLSQPQVVLSTRSRDGQLVIIDDFREAYWWLRDNTPQDARVMAWWDYGYQINGIANRTSIADGNTWNFEHIAMLGKCLLSKEKEAHAWIRHLADYVLVWTGRFIGYMSDDMAKMPQLANIAGSIYPDIDRQGYFIDRNNNPTPAAKESLLYKLTFFGKDDGSIQLKYFKEVYTSKYSMVRIYKVLDVAPRTPFGKYAPELKLGQYPKTGP